MMRASIFNDVLGPVMIGPSSSHAAAASRIGRMAARLLAPDTVGVTVIFAKDGSLVDTHTSQGSDMGFACGLLGMEPDDPRTPQGTALAREKMNLSFRTDGEHAEHPNDYLVEVHSSRTVNVLRAISTGGGMIKVYGINGIPVELYGDTYELFIFMGAQGLPCEALPAGVHKTVHDGAVQYSSSARFDPDFIRAAVLSHESAPCFSFEPVMPVPAMREGVLLPFTDSAALTALIRSCGGKETLASYALEYEKRRSGADGETLYGMAERVLGIMERAMASGMAREYYADRLLQSQAYKLVGADPASLLPTPAMNDVAAGITAVMEAKSSMKAIVAAPTAGSCGCLPGTLLSIAKRMNATRASVLNALFAAGMVGVFFTSEATFAAEVGGCQMECGAASGMTAAALCELAGAGAQISLNAASLALQAVTGLACDPVAGRVECPCLSKNVMAGANAVTSANMALSGFDPVIPLDETIAAIYTIGKSLPAAIRCTRGGLGLSPTSLTLRERLDRDGHL